MERWLESEQSASLSTAVLPTFLIRPCALSSFRKIISARAITDLDNLPASVSTPPPGRQLQRSQLQSPNPSSFHLSAAKFHLHSLPPQKRGELAHSLAGSPAASPGALSIPVLNSLNCCQSAHISGARQANRINPGLTLQACVQGNGLC